MKISFLPAVIIALLSATLALTACNKATTDANDSPSKSAASNKIIVGASSTPHAEILEFVQPILAKQGIDLEIRKFNDYVLPNTALAADELDANFFQHLPYLNRALKDHANDPSYDFVNVGSVFITPIGIYSTKYKSLTELPDNALIVTSSNIAERGRVLSIFVKTGLITIKSGVEPLTATFDDIDSNPKNLHFKGDIEPALMPQLHKNAEGDAQVINANFAIISGLNPATDPIHIESPQNNPYANILVVRKKNASNPAILALRDALQLPQTKAFMLEKFKGAVVPVE